jgi:hypothetical protein
MIVKYCYRPTEMKRILFQIHLRGDGVLLEMVVGAERRETAVGEGSVKRGSTGIHRWGLEHE